MTWIVDTCIILDILDKHPVFAEMSSCALQKGGLITRNEADFKTLYPNLTIFNPVPSVP